MNYILSKQENYLECLKTVSACWDARKKQLYTVEIKRWSKKRTLQQNAMYWAMCSEVAWVVNEAQGYEQKGKWYNVLNRFDKNDIHAEFGEQCPYLGVVAYTGLDGEIHTKTISTTSLDTKIMGQVIEYLFKWAQDKGIYLESYDDHITATDN